MTTAEVSMPPTVTHTLYLQQTAPLPISCRLSPQVKGLKGLTYMDKSKDPKNPEFKTESREVVTFGEALVDSVYTKAPEHVELEVGTGQYGDGVAVLCCRQ